MKKSIISFIILIIGFNSFSQILKPGFYKSEYQELLRVMISTHVNNFENVDSVYIPENFELQYRSKVMALDNRWDLWTCGDSISAISIRGTTSSSESMLENFYSVMSPAKGTMKLNDSVTFNYTLSEDPKAAVHTGWLMALAFLSQDILPKIDSMYNKGQKEFYLVGYSQGGSIAYLLTNYFYYLQKQGKLHSDIKFKTYCNASPKPGNLYFAYDYESHTKDWAFNIVNAADWVPQSPFSVETPMDMSLTNPFLNSETLFGKQKFPKNLIIKHTFNKMYKPLYKTQKKNKKYFGNKLTPKVQNYIPGFEPPEFSNYTYYARCGQYIVMYPDADYYEIFPEKADKVWIHHMPKAYLYLVDKLKE